MGTVRPTKGFDARMANRPFLVFDFRALWHSTLKFICVQSRAYMFRALETIFTFEEK